MIQLLNSVPQELLSLESTPVDIQRQKWQLLAKEIMESENDEACELVYSKSPELLRMVLLGVKVVFEFPAEELGDETHQSVMNVDALQTNLIDHFANKTGKLFVTSRRLLYALEEGNGRAVQFDYHSLLMHAVPKTSDDIPRLLCHFDTADMKDAMGDDIPLFDKKALAELEEDPDYMPYFEALFSCEGDANPIDDLYNAVMDATMLAGFSPSMVKDIFGGIEGGCCGAKETNCCVGQACCDSDDSDRGACCNGADRGCCASESE
jgi:hypothetical protein